MAMTVIPVILLFVGLFWFRKRFILTDQKMEEITEKLHEKQGRQQEGVSL